MPLNIHTITTLLKVLIIKSTSQIASYTTIIILRTLKPEFFCILRANQLNHRRKNTK